jgi:hypothetical protein
VLLDGEGTVEIVLPGSENTCTVTLENTSLGVTARLPNILSLFKLGSMGLYVEWDGDTITIRSQETKELLATAVRRKDGLYYL